MAKEEGQDIVLSNFITCEFDFRLKLSKAQLVHVNQMKEGEDYLETEAAMRVYKPTKKQKLISSLCCIFSIQYKSTKILGLQHNCTPI